MLSVESARRVLLNIEYVVEVLLHQLAVDELVTTEVGLTFTETLNGVPVHPFNVGVMR